MTTTLAIDFGTSFTTAALRRDSHTEMLELHSGNRKLPSAVLRVGDGFEVGRQAIGQAALYPGAFERTPKRRLRQDEHVQLGGDTVRPVAMVSAVLGTVMEVVHRHQGDAPLDRIVLTHPAVWGGPTKKLLVDALDSTGLSAGSKVLLCAEPVAAVHHYVQDPRAVVNLAAVFDLGGGTLDTAVLQRDGERLELVGPPGGDEALGGEDFDDRIVQYVYAMLEKDDAGLVNEMRTSSDPQVSHARHELRKGATATKEALSLNNQYSFFIPHPVKRDMTLTREEFDSLIAADVDRAIDLLADTVEAAEEQAGMDVEAIFLVGGSSRIPKVVRSIEERLGQRARLKDEPKEVVAKGATIADVDCQPYLGASAPPQVVTTKRDPQPDPPKPQPQPEPKPEQTQSPGPIPPTFPPGPVTPDLRPPILVPQTVLASRGLRFGGSMLEAVLAVFTLGIGWLIWAIAATWPKGQSPAKSMLDMYVIDLKTGRPATTGKMAARYGVDLAFNVVGIFTLFIPVLVNSGAIFFSPQNQRLTDRIMSTVVVRTVPQMPTGMPPMPPMPPS